MSGWLIRRWSAPFPSTISMGWKAGRVWTATAVRSPICGSKPALRFVIPAQDILGFTQNRVGTMGKGIWVAGAMLGGIFAWQFAEAASPAALPAVITTADGQL